MEIPMLPGFRFHPTEQELVGYYLKNSVLDKSLRCDPIGFLDIYLHDPWDLPDLANMIGEREWYFLVPREGKNSHGGRPNRTTKKGYWKSTGCDRTIRCLSETGKILGHRKTLVFYQGKAPRGFRTDWVMNEYKLPNSYCSKENVVLCKIYRKATSLKALEQMAEVAASARPYHSHDMAFNSNPQNKGTIDTFQAEYNRSEAFSPQYLSNITERGEMIQEDCVSPAGTESMEEKLANLQLPNLSVDWTVDSLTQLGSACSYAMWRSTQPI